MSDKARAALYCRVSTDAQAERYGLAAQDWALRKRAQERGYSLISDGEQDAFVDDGYSGGDLNRPALSRLRHAIREGQVEVVLCYDPDRLSRSLSDLLLLTDEVERAGVRLEFITQETDASPEGRMFFAMRGAVAEYERAKIRERTIRGRLQKARQGKVISRAAAPYGYRYDPVTSTLVVDEEEARTVRMVFHLYSQERLSLIKLVDRLNRLGIPRPSNGQRWHISFVAGMLRNETYTGTLWQNRWCRQRVAAKPGQKPKRRMYQRPKEEQIPVAVPAIIPKEAFEGVQRRLVENKRWASRNNGHDYLLSGLLKHACGSSMGARTSHGTPYYYCLKSNRFKAPIDERGEPQPCSCTWVNSHALESVVWDTVTGLLRRPDLLMQELERLTRPDSATREALEEELARVRKRLEELPREEQRLVEGYRKGLYADFMMREEMERVRSERTSAEERRRELERQLARLDRALSYQGQVEALAQTLTQGLEAMDFQQRRELLRLLVDEIIYDDGRVTIKTIIPLGGSPDKVQLYPVPQGGQGDGRKGFSSPC
ncbi:MAG: recombinase family protein [Chloroflexota bacterium]|nr:recombinase family protein [Chloroflexota bacterium]